MLHTILEVGDRQLSDTLLEAYMALMEALPQVTPLGPEDKPVMNGYRKISDNGRSQVYRIFSKVNDKPYRVLLQISEKVPGIYNANFIKEGQQNYDATGEGSKRVVDSVFAVLRDLADKTQMDGFIFSGGDTDELTKEKKERVYHAYLKRYFPDFEEVPDELKPPVWRGKINFWKKKGA